MMSVDLDPTEIEKCQLLFKAYQYTEDKTISIWDAHKPLQGNFIPLLYLFI
jgi:hypothetical protein